MATYIGLRENRKGPPVTSASDGLLGFAVVPDRRIVKNAQRANAALRTNTKPLTITCARDAGKRLIGETA